MPFLDRVAAVLETVLGISQPLQAKIFGTLLVMGVYVVTIRIARRITARTVDDASNRYSVGKAASYVLGFIAISVTLRIWLEAVNGMATYFGLLSAGVAVALQDPLINLAGWLFVVSRRPFEVGDRIQIGAHLGDVVDQRIFQFTLLEIGNWVQADQSTGRVIHVPNGLVFKNPVANYDKGFRYIWNEVAVILTFESNWKKAKEVLLQTVTDHAEHLTDDATHQVEKAAERYHIKLAKLTPIVWTSVTESGVRMTMRYLCKPRDRRSSESEIWESILDALAPHTDIELAYPTTRFYDRLGEHSREKSA